MKGKKFFIQERREEDAIEFSHTGLCLVSLSYFSNVLFLFHLSSNDNDFFLFVYIFYIVIGHLDLIRSEICTMYEARSFTHA